MAEFNLSSWAQTECRRQGPPMMTYVEICRLCKDLKIVTCVRIAT